jgi:hypothetical protein
MARFDFNTEFNRTRSRVNWIFRIAVFGIILAGLYGVAQAALIAYAAVKYGPRYLDAGAKYLEKESQ